MLSIKELQKQVRNFFGISTVEANAFIILLPLLLILLLLFPFYHHFFPPKEVTFLRDKQQLETMLSKLEEKKEKIPEKLHSQRRHLSALDPNVAGFDDLIYIGMDTITSARIIKYRNAGGEFRYKQDLLRIYGLGKEKFAAIKAKIALPDKPQVLDPPEVTTLAASPRIEKDEPVKIEILKPELSKFDINTVDSLTLMKINGIGPVLSSRIIKYRDFLGGFADSAQYKEVYGLSTEVLEQLFLYAVIDKDFVITTININEAEAADLARHPYISWKIANAIVAYRKQHGNYYSTEQLLEIKLIDRKTLDKIDAYLSL